MSPLERAVCDRVIAIRRELQISQSQLAHLLNADPRTIKRWERYECKPRRRQRQWLWRLSQFATDLGPEAFRARFLNDEEPRYHQPGPAGHLGELLFDTHLRPQPGTEPGALGSR